MRMKLYVFLWIIVALITLIYGIRDDVDDVTALSVEILNQKINDLAENLKTKDERFEELERRLQHEIHYLRENLLEKDRKIATLSERLSEQDRKIGTLENGQLEKNSEIDELRNKLSENELKFGAISGKFLNLKQELRSLKRYFHHEDTKRKNMEMPFSKHPFSNNAKDEKTKPYIRNHGDYAFEDAKPEISSKGNIQTRYNKNHTLFPPVNRRGISALGGQQNAVVAFYAYMSTSEPTPSRHHTIVFDHVVTNEGHGYNGFTGIFIAPSSGTYHFSWTIYADKHSFTFTEIVKNNAVYGSSIADSDEITDYHTSTGNAILSLQNNDVIFIRTSASVNSKGDIASNAHYRSTFSGFLIH